MNSWRAGWGLPLGSLSTRVSGPIRMASLPAASAEGESALGPHSRLPISNLASSLLQAIYAGVLWLFLLALLRLTWAGRSGCRPRLTIERLNWPFQLEDIHAPAVFVFHGEEEEG